MVPGAPGAAAGNLGWRGPALAGRHRLVDRVAGDLGAEPRAIAGAEALDRLVVQQHLADRSEHHTVERAGGALGHRVDASDRFFDALAGEAIDPLLAARIDDLRRGYLQREGEYGAAAEITRALGFVTDWYFVGPFDNASVMLYRFAPFFYRTDPSACAPTGNGVDLSEGDKRGLQLLYPDVESDVAAIVAKAAQASASLGNGGQETAGATSAYEERVRRMLEEWTS